MRPALTLSVAAALSSALWLLLGGAWVATLELFPALAGAAGRYRGAAARCSSRLGVLLYLLVAAGHYLALAVEASRSAERRALEARVLAREAELKALRAQVDPHFLFNSLNAVAALAGGDPAAARRMALMLADFLRQSLRLVERATIPLDEELALVRAYLAIEQVRFGERLAVAERLDPAAGVVPVPPLLLQPLVENAVKHGIAGLVERRADRDRHPPPGRFRHRRGGQRPRSRGCLGAAGAVGRWPGRRHRRHRPRQRPPAPGGALRRRSRACAPPPSPGASGSRCACRGSEKVESDPRPQWGGGDGGRTPRGERGERTYRKRWDEQQSEVDQRIGLPRPVAAGDLEGRIEKLDAEP